MKKLHDMLSCLPDMLNKVADKRGSEWREASDMADDADMEADDMEAAKKQAIIVLVIGANKGKDKDDDYAET